MVNGWRQWRVVCTLCAALWLPSLSGCAFEGQKLFSSRWAMENKQYASQYGQPYSDDKLSKWGRMGQQMVDARFQKESTGLYAGAGGATKERGAFAGELGVFHMPTSWSTVRVGAVGMLAEGLPNYLTGAVVGGRIHAPTRFSPYIGLAGMAGYAKTTTRAQHSYVDDNGHLVMEGDDVPGPSAGMAAIIPEVGVSWWLTSRTRCNVNSSYYFTTDGRSQDFLLLGISFDWAPDNHDNDTCTVPGLAIDTEGDTNLESDPYFHVKPNTREPAQPSEPWDALPAITDESPRVEPEVQP